MTNKKSLVLQQIHIRIYGTCEFHIVGLESATRNYHYHHI
jgi:hypothetical protein